MGTILEALKKLNNLIESEDSHFEDQEEDENDWSDEEISYQILKDSPNPTYDPCVVFKPYSANQSTAVLKIDITRGEWDDISESHYVVPCIRRVDQHYIEAIGSNSKTQSFDMSKHLQIVRKCQEQGVDLYQIPDCVYLDYISSEYPDYSIDESNAANIQKLQIPKHNLTGMQHFINCCSRRQWEADGIIAFKNYMKKYYAVVADAYKEIYGSQCLPFELRMNSAQRNVGEKSFHNNSDNFGMFLDDIIQRGDLDDSLYFYLHPDASGQLIWSDNYDEDEDMEESYSILSEDLESDKDWSDEELEAEITGINSIENYREIYNAIKNELYSGNCYYNRSFHWLNVFADRCFQEADSKLKKFREESVDPEHPNPTIYNSPDPFEMFFKYEIKQRLEEFCKSLYQRINSWVVRSLLDILNSRMERFNFFIAIKDHQGIQLDTFDSVTVEWLCAAFNLIWDDFYANFDSKLKEKHYPKQIEDLIRTYIVPKMINFQTKKN